MSSSDAKTARFGEPEPERDLQPGFLAGWTRYDIISRLGDGGMGEVFKAWDPQLGRHVALKFLYGTDEETLERFSREARAQARVDHPSICKVYEVGSVGGRPYIAMQEIDGVALDEASRGLTIEQKVRVVRDVVDAIHAAHRLGLIHRDLKPGNILVERHDDELRPYVVDFGLARDQESPSGYTISGTIAGTVGYMSPEQARGKADLIDRRTDVYSLGIILYELLAGRTPFDTTDLVAIVRTQSEDAPSPRKFAPTIPRDLETIVLKCLERDPARRYDSARALAEDLGRFLDGEPILARPASLVYRMGKRVAKHRGIAAVALLALALLAFAGWSRWEAARRAELAHRFGLQVKEIELVTRIANMLPADHPTPARRLLAHRMERIRREMAGQGAIARGPGSYALARGNLVLGDLAEASRLIAAAFAAGYDTPDVRYTRGEIEGRFYQEALTKAANIGDRGLREGAIRAAQAKYRDPALRSLRAAGEASVANPAFLEAQIAMFEERWTDAIVAARRAAGAEPWMYEARMLEAAVLRAKAADEGHAGRIDEALRTLDDAGKVMTAVLQIARSDAVAYIEECRRRVQHTRFVEFKRRLTDAEVEVANAPCLQAIALDANAADAWATMANMHNIAAGSEARHGDDPSAHSAAAVAAAERALAISPNDATPHEIRGLAFFSLARRSFAKGIDPRRDLETAEASLRRALTLEPRAPNANNAMANVLLFRSYSADRYGGDPAPFLRSAIAHYSRALDASPSFNIAHSNMGTAWVHLADHAFKQGGDPGPMLDQAIRHLTRGVQTMPDNISAHNNLGNALLSLAEYAPKQGRDPAPHAEQAIAAFRRALALRPDYALPHYNIAYAMRIVAEDRARRGLDASAQWKTAREELDAYDRLAPGDPDSRDLREKIERAASGI